MNVSIVQPDAPDETPRIAPVPAASSAAAPDPVGFGNLVDLFVEGGRAEDRAVRAESAFAHGSGDLQAMVIERAHADILIGAASAAASRLTQSLQTLLNMQV